LPSEALILTRAIGLTHHRDRADELGEKMVDISSGSNLRHFAMEDDGSSLTVIG
jgi:hypothetical protein